MQLSKPRVVIVGAGFGGIKAAKKLKNANVDVVLIDKNNHHLFQPLLYQVATSALSPGDISAPIRTVMHGYRNVQVIMNEVLSIDTEKSIIELADGYLDFDYLILAPGNRHSYFGNNQWEEFAPGLKSLKDALKLRENILISFEKAERHYKSEKRKKYLNFVVVGGGPTGVELAGAIAEISKRTMLPDFPLLKEEEIRVFLFEGGDRLLAQYPEDLSDYTKKSLEELGVEVHTKTRVLEIHDNLVVTNEGKVVSANIIWAAGNEASPMLKSLGSGLDKGGRVLVEPDCSLPGHPNIFVIGDAASLTDAKGNPVPGIAPAANQMGEYAANIIRKKIPPAKRIPFIYKDKGSMATIGRAKAVAVFGKWKITGFLAWLMWSFVHIFFLIDFRNRFKVMFEWIWYYITSQPGARLIIHKSSKNREEKETYSEIS